MKLAIVIPAFNEERRLPKTLRSILEHARGRQLDFEILVVNDGSTDQTERVVQDFAKEHPQVKLVSYAQNHGKGYAVRLGSLQAAADRILFCDADGAAPIEELRRLERALNEGADIAIGSRALDSEETTLETRLHRKVIGRIFANIVNLLVVPGIKDTQCGFKLFTRPACRHVFSRQRLDGFAFDVEILQIAMRAGFKIKEVPINWKDMPGSKVRLTRDPALMAMDLLRLLKWHWTGD